MRIVVLTGAGISRESGLNTFRDSGGLWEGHRVEDVATPDAFNRDPQLVLEFYNQRRRDVLAAEPNPAHIALAKLEASHQVTIVTQNVDDLHERGGSRKVIHLHGEVLKARSVQLPNEVFDWTTDMQLGDLGSDGHQLRPHIVWFEEPILQFVEAYEASVDAELFIVVGTSLSVYPAASLLDATLAGMAFLIDPKPTRESRRHGKLTVLETVASVGVPVLVEHFLEREF